MRYPVSLEVSPLECVPNSWNTNIVSPENEAKLDAAIKRYGFFKPIVVRELAGGQYEILGGEHRWLAAKRAGMKTIPAMNLGPIDEEKAKEISLADNARYGADDAMALAELLNSLTDVDHIGDFLPYTDADLRAVFSSTDIALDELEIDESFDKKEENPDPIAPKEPKTHTIMRFKVLNRDAERITTRIEQTKKAQDFTASDDLTNAGDALVHLLGLVEDDD